MQNKWAWFFLFVHCCIVFLFGWTTYFDGPPTGDYSMWMDIHVMIALGFGFLMAFMARNSFTATSHSFIASCFVFLWSILNLGFWHRIIDPNPQTKWDRIHIGIDTLVNADFCSGAILISFGAVIGKVSLTQLLVMCTIEVIFYCINEAICYTRFNLADIGGSMVIHVFGATFGLVCSLFLERDEDRKKKLKGKSPAITHGSDTLAMVGVIFLWSFWPSFNSYMGGQINSGTLAQRSAVNTSLSIAASTVSAILISSIIGNGKISMVDVQNATLAGGVSMGASANMLITPYGALIVGTAAGALSVVGFNYILPALDRGIGLKDTCGILNLHCMPGIFGAIVSVIVTGSASNDNYVQNGYAPNTIWSSYPSRTFSELAGSQLAALGTSLGFAMLSGAFTGVLLRAIDPLDSYFEDSEEFLVHDGEKGSPTSPHNPIAASGASHFAAEQGQHQPLEMQTAA